MYLAIVSSETSVTKVETAALANYTCSYTFIYLQPGNEATIDPTSTKVRTVNLRLHYYRHFSKIVFSTNPNCACCNQQTRFLHCSSHIVYAIRTLLGPTRNIFSSEYWYVGVLFSELVQYLSCRVNTNLPKHHLSSAPMQEPQWLSWWEHLRRSRFQFWLGSQCSFFFFSPSQFKFLA